MRSIIASVRPWQAGDLAFWRRPAGQPTAPRAIFLFLPQSPCILPAARVEKGRFPAFHPCTCEERDNAMMDLFKEWWFWLGILAIAGLVGVLIYLRNHRPED